MTHLATVARKPPNAADIEDDVFPFSVPAVRSLTGLDLSAPVTFFQELNTGMYTGTLANQGGFHLDFPDVGSGLTNAGATPSPQSRSISTAR